MYQIFRNPNLKFYCMFIIVGLVGTSIGIADDDLDEGKKSKELVAEMKKKEGELREETRKKITQVRELALTHLEKAHEQYLSQKKQAEADIIAKEINQLRAKLGMPPVGNKLASMPNQKVNVQSNNKGNQHVLFNTNYLFNRKELIYGKLNFMPNQKVNISYNYKGKNKTELADWKDMGDHVQVNAGDLVGQILISTNPSSNKKNLLIRWGGELTNKLTEANAE